MLVRPLCDKPGRLLHLGFKTRPRDFSSGVNDRAREFVNAFVHRL